VLGAGLSGNTLAVDLKTLGLGFLLGLIVGVDALNEGLAGAGLTDVLNAEMKSLGDNAGVDALVDNDTDGVPGNIEDLAGLAVVELVGHTTLATAVGDNVNVISLLVDGEEVLQTNGTVLTVGLGKQITNSSHGLILSLNYVHPLAGQTLVLKLGHFEISKGHGQAVC